MKKFLISIFFLSSSAFAKTFLLSSAQSGQEWLQYSVQHLTNRLCGENLFRLGYDPNKPQLFVVEKLASHQKDGILILLLRDYKEVLYRQKIRGGNGLEGYFQNLKVFHNWNEQKRFLVYYEDLIDEPERVLPELLTFLQENKRGLRLFLTELEFRGESVWATLNRLGISTFPEEEDFYYHTRKKSKNELFEMDKKARAVHPGLFERYLTRYEEAI